MGTWGTGISSNDTYADVYAEFFELYNDGATVEEISAKLVRANEETIIDPHSSNDFWFAMAKAKWECKALDNDLFGKVKKIIETGSDIEVWRDQDASENDLRKRDKALKSFLSKISVEKLNPRKRKRVPVGVPTFEKGDCIVFKLGNGNYGGAIVLGSLVGKGYAYNLVASTRINQQELPNEKDFRNAQVMVCNYAKWDNEVWIHWMFCRTFQKYAGHFQRVSRLEVLKDYQTFDYGAAGDWKGVLIDSIERQYEHEMSFSGPKKRVKVTTLIGRKWLNFF